MEKIESACGTSVKYNLDNSIFILSFYYIIYYINDQMYSNDTLLRNFKTVSLYN